MTREYIKTIEKNCQRTIDVSTALIEYLKALDDMYEKKRAFQKLLGTPEEREKNKKVFLDFLREKSPEVYNKFVSNNHLK